MEPYEPTRQGSVIASAVLETTAASPFIRLATTPTIPFLQRLPRAGHIRCHLYVQRAGIMGIAAGGGILCRLG
jgi:hypothetical protein